MDVLLYHARRMHLMAWQLQLQLQFHWRKNTSRHYTTYCGATFCGEPWNVMLARLQREYLTAYYSSQVSAVPWQQAGLAMYNSVNSEIIKLVPRVIIIREGIL